MTPEPTDSKTDEDEPQPRYRFKPHAIWRDFEPDTFGHRLMMTIELNRLSSMNYRAPDKGTRKERIIIASVFLVSFVIGFGVTWFKRQ